MKSTRIYVLLAVLLAMFNQSCKKSRSDIGAVLFKETKNKVFKKVDTAMYYTTFRKVLEEEQGHLRNAAVINEFYRSGDYEPYFLMHFVPKDQLVLLADRLKDASTHGLNPELFGYSTFQELVDKIYQKKAIKTPQEACEVIARAELMAANSLLSYASAMHYGVVNPRKIFARYYMKTGKPDSAFFRKALSVTDLKAYLDTLPPSSPVYAKLREGLASGFVYPGLSKEETRRAILLSLERLRWQNKPVGDRYVWVNIADYSLLFVDKGKTALSMKVCVGKGPDQSQSDADYDESEGSVRPHDHSTPQLNSEIYNSQVNPIWNIPESIAKNEIYDKVLNDPYYLVNNNMDVYDQRGRKVDADAIDWSEIPKDNIPYSFKQGSGDDNSLGKIKFQFLNASAVYLHDTPAKAPFKLTVRAVSHGCVRLEKPLELAKMLYGDGPKYDLIQKELQEKNPTARDIPVSPKVPVYLDYLTCFVDDSGNIQVRPDVYRLDEVLARRTKGMLIK